MNLLSIALLSALNATSFTRPMANTLILAQTQIQNISGLKSIVGKIVAVIIILSFVASLGFLVAGLLKRSSEPDEAKKIFITAGLIAIAPVVLGLFYYLAGLGDATVSANFND